MSTRHHTSLAKPSPNPMANPRLGRQGKVTLQPSEIFLLLPQEFEIEAPLHYPASLIARLRELLTALPGAVEVSVRSDPQRPDMYDVEDVESDGRIFFIHLDRSRRRVVLLASWLRQTA